MRRGVVGVVLAVSGGTLLAGGLVSGPASGATGAGKRPDLVVTKSALQLRGGGSWTTQLATRTFTWRHRTKNVGGARAKKSRTGVAFFVRPGTSTEPSGASLRVPPLAPGEAHADRGRFSVDFSDWDYGTYRTKVCADVRDRVTERDDGNNCQPTGKFYVAPLQLSGRVEGKATWAPLPGFVQAISWGGTVGFDLSNGAPSGDKGVFDYHYYTGKIAFGYAWEDANSGCKATGSAVYTPSESATVRLVFGTDPGYRVLSASFAPSFRVPLTVTCPMTPPTTSPVAPFGGGSAPWLATGSTSPFPDPGLSAISGTFQLVATTAPVTYTWNLVASG